MSARKQNKNFRITERDVEVVRWLGRVRLATVEQVRVRFDLGRTKAYERLAGLVASGLVVHERGVPGHGVYLTSREGLGMAGLELAAATVSLGGLAHDLAVAGVVAELERAMPMATLLTERELRAHVRETGDRTFRPRVSQRGMRESRHWPDLVLLTSGEQAGWVAIEVELQRKGAQRLEAILRGYSNANGTTGMQRALKGVLYLVPDAKDLDRVATIARRANLTMDSDPVFAAHSLDGDEGIAAAIVELLQAYDAVQERRREQAEQRAEQERRLAARQAAERAAMEAHAELQRQRQLEAQRATAAAQKRGLGRLFGA